MSFAVVDFETTGILPSYHHRVVEIGVTHVEDDGTITARWETLVNPERDLGRQNIHGVRAADILDAPVFADIAAEFIDLLRGRVFAAHNATFDLRFLHAEFERAGYWLNADIPSVCTMALGSNFGLGASCSLAHACVSCSIESGLSHSAGADSYATAQLLSHYQQTSSTWPGWSEYWHRTAETGRTYAYPAGQRSRAAAKPRPAASVAPVHFLERISTESVRDAVDGAASQYTAILDRCLLDGFISVSEGAQLGALATELGLTRTAVQGIHRDYYLELERRAWADGILTNDEKADLRRVGDLLQLSDDDIATAVDDERPDDVNMTLFEGFTLAPGDLVVLTGEMVRPRDAWETELRERGCLPHPSVTKKVKLVVAADPDSLSGKAKKARDYGIPIVNEDGLSRLLGNVAPK